MYMLNHLYFSIFCFEFNLNRIIFLMMKNYGVTDDTLGYLNAVKVAFQNNMEKYDQFLQVLRDFIANRIYISDVKAKFKTLFKGHRYLIFKFNSFVPMNHRIALFSPEDALGFVQAVHQATQYKGESKFNEFLKVLKDYKDQTIDISSFTSRVKVVLKTHPDLILEFNSIMPKEHQITLSSEEESFLRALKLMVQYKRESNFQYYGKVLENFKGLTIDISCLTARLEVLIKNHPELILEFKIFMPSGKKLKDDGHLGHFLPWDVLDIICKKLDFDDLFSFSGVCKSWRTFHKSNFLSSQEPLLVHITGNCTHSYSFISIPNQKVYDLTMMSSFQPPDCVYVRVSSGYFILAHKNNSFLLLNQFTLEKRVINANFTVESQFSDRYEALLAFEKCSEEYVLVVLCKYSSHLYVYQSRYHGWFTYSTLKPKELVVDFVVLNNIIYVVTDKANIGVLNLNSKNIQFLNLKNTPSKIPSKLPSDSFKLVNCDEQLFVFHSISINYKREVYKIDLSTMNYVKMKTLGDIALFYVSGRNCRALSNPKRFGYESNHVYEVSSLSQCTKYDWNAGRPSKIWSAGCTSKIYPYLRSLKDFNLFDWCFRHVKYEVDYSLVE
ncbi:uncharacterized protein LOC131635782 isoform X2 [Vicia villosa]|uniref:uncharacterized protein LOC131635782 isoform X2 n=1 Tax=Vicia villosa TaxID=3911 RepID=UPI00273B4527|nr:uncharacterized protein LOC131635782 isoform X2 [Vicia villosa]